MDMEEKLEKANEWMEKFGENSPEKMGGFGELMEAVESEGALSTKDKELMAIALSIAHECDWCVAFHVNAAMEAGATEDEIIESAWMAVLMGGGPALMHAGLVLDALRDLN